MKLLIVSLIVTFSVACGPMRIPVEPAPLDTAFELRYYEYVNPYIRIAVIRHKQTAKCFIITASDGKAMLEVSPEVCN